MLPILYAVFPKDFDRFIDVFGGSGSVLLGKPPSKFEVYNDIDGELVNLFRVAKNRIAELLLELDLLPLNSREEFDAWLHFHEGAGDPTPYLPAQLEIVDCLVPQEWAVRLKEKLCQRADYREVRQAAAFFMRTRNSYASNGKSFACQPFNVRTMFQQLAEMSVRLENVVVEHKSFEKLIPHYDREDAFFYGDPPYCRSEYVYRILYSVVRNIYPEIVTHDPVEVYNISGTADVLCVRQATYEQYFEEFRSLQALGQKMTYYACGCPAGPTMNRVIDLPLFVGRLSFWMCHRYNMEGYLHWGYHASSCISNTNYMDLLTPGNANIVYAVGRDFWESMRSHGQRAGAEDWELLSVIKENNPTLCQQIIVTGCRSFNDYERNSDVIDQIHVRILEEADAYF